jgi:hypothetical protein
MTGNPTEDFNMSLLPLDVYREIMGAWPYHFWQMKDSVVADTYGECNVPFVHYRWLCDKGVGRYDILRAIALAESKIADFLSYWPGIQYTENEEILLPRARGALYPRWPQVVETKWKHIQHIGKLTKTLIQAGVVMTYGAGDTITITTTVTAGTPSSEITVCYAGTTVPLRPVTVTVTGTTATIVINKWLCLKPSLWMIRFTPNVGANYLYDCSIASNLISTIDVYRFWIDESQHMQLVWGTINTCDTPSCGQEMAEACVVVERDKLGIISWYPVETTWPCNVTSMPDKLYVSYSHGIDNTSIDWAQIVTHFATALLEDVGCDCQSLSNTFKYWQKDLAETSALGSRMMAPTHVASRFGTKRGCKEAWDFCYNRVGN